ncbi:MAG: fibronectin type III domain-containing protein, partial [Bryobacterales bacterium]|nr:fibronectin type III domain-containing protein [Bryobacteraceae bacterium]MDW8131891.1 fibronectin type III domain-containing protein [Bryobacterales bacterium]
MAGEVTHPRAAALGLWLYALALLPAFATSHSPYLQNVGGDRATVVWVTREPVAAVVEYSADGKQWRAVPATSRALVNRVTGEVRHQHQAELSGLSPGVVYHYRVLA